MSNPYQCILSFSFLQVSDLPDDLSSLIKIIVESVSGRDLHSFAKGSFRMMDKMITVETITAKEEPLGPASLTLRPG